MVKSKILYVDDEIINLKLFGAILGKKYPILTAENGRSGLDILTGDKDIQVVISDMKMPNMNGIEFIALAVKIAPHISFYILTGFEITDQIQNVLDVGMIRKYFRKPFNLNEISAEIDNVLEKSKN
jgi:two-component system, response regulator, stage 0 sporulation protein F